MLSMEMVEEFTRREALIAQPQFRFLHNHSFEELRDITILYPAVVCEAMIVEMTKDIRMYGVPCCLYTTKRIIAQAF
jgi:hypothetical protein